MEELFNNLNLKDLYKVQDLLEDVISQKIIVHQKLTMEKDINDYIDYVDDYIPPSNTVVHNAITADLEKTGINVPSEGVSSIWITLLDEPYVWESKKI